MSKRPRPGCYRRGIRRVGTPGLAGPQGDAPERSPSSGAYAGRLTGDTLKLIAFILPLALDTFGVALALGIAGLPPRSRIRVALLFAGFETAMSVHASPGGERG